MAHPTAYRHQGEVVLNRADGSMLRLTTAEAAAITALFAPAGAAREAVERHLDAHRTPLGSRHGDPFAPGA